MSKKWGKTVSLRRRKKSSDDLERIAKDEAQTSKLPHVREGMYHCKECGSKFYTEEKAQACHKSGIYLARGKGASVDKGWQDWLARVAQALKVGVAALSGWKDKLQRLFDSGKKPEQAAVEVEPQLSFLKPGKLADQTVRRLQGLGYSNYQIGRMKPQEAWDATHGYGGGGPGMFGKSVDKAIEKGWKTWVAATAAVLGITSVALLALAIRRNGASGKVLEELFEAQATPEQAAEKLRPYVVQDGIVMSGRRELLSRMGYRDEMIQSKAMDQAKVIAVDLNGTLASGRGPDPESWGEPQDGAVEAMQRLKDEGYVVAINSVVGDVDAIRGWLDGHGIAYDYVNESPAQPEGSSDKLNAQAYLDDRAVPYRGDWKATLDDLFGSGILEKHVMVSIAKAGKVRVTLRHRSGDPARGRPAMGEILPDGTFKDDSTGTIYQKDEFYRSRPSSSDDADDVTKTYEAKDGRRADIGYKVRCLEDGKIGIVTELLDPYVHVKLNNGNERDLMPKTFEIVDDKNKAIGDAYAQFRAPDWYVVGRSGEDLAGPLGSKDEAEREASKLNFKSQKRVKRLDKGQYLDQNEDNSIWVLTTGDLDRDGETVDPEGVDFSEFDLNPIVVDNHNTDGGVTEVILGKIVRHWLDEIGEGTKWPQVGGQRRPAQLGEIEWNMENEAGPQAARMAKAGQLNGGSVSFVPLKEASKNSNGGNHYAKVKLLEFTLCPVGSNPSAVRLKRLKGVRDYLPGWKTWVAALAAYIGLPVSVFVAGKLADVAYQAWLKGTAARDAARILESHTAVKALCRKANMDFKIGDNISTNDGATGVIESEGDVEGSWIVRMDDGSTENLWPREISLKKAADVDVDVLANEVVEQSDGDPEKIDEAMKDCEVPEPMQAAVKSIVARRLKRHRKCWINKRTKTAWVLKSEGEELDPYEEQELIDMGVEEVVVEDTAPEDAEFEETKGLSTKEFDEWVKRVTSVLNIAKDPFLQRIGSTGMDKLLTWFKSKVDPYIAARDLVEDADLTFAGLHGSKPAPKPMPTGSTIQPMGQYRSLKSEDDVAMRAVDLEQKGAELDDAVDAAMAEGEVDESLTKSIKRKAGDFSGWVGLLQTALNVMKNPIAQSIAANLFTKYADKLAQMYGRRYEPTQAAQQLIDAVGAAGGRMLGTLGKSRTKGAFGVGTQHEGSDGDSGTVEEVAFVPATSDVRRVYINGKWYSTPNDPNPLPLTVEKASNEEWVVIWAGKTYGPFETEEEAKAKRDELGDGSIYSRPSGTLDQLRGKSHRRKAMSESDLAREWDGMDEGTLEGFGIHPRMDSSGNVLPWSQQDAQSRQYFKESVEDRDSGHKSHRRKSFEEETGPVGLRALKKLVKAMEEEMKVLHKSEQPHVIDAIEDALKRFKNTMRRAYKDAGEEDPDALKKGMRFMSKGKRYVCKSNDDGVIESVDGKYFDEDVLGKGAFDSKEAVECNKAGVGGYELEPTEENGKWFVTVYDGGQEVFTTTSYASQSDADNDATRWIQGHPKSKSRRSKRLSKADTDVVKETTETLESMAGGSDLPKHLKGTLRKIAEDLKGLCTKEISEDPDAEMPEELVRSFEKSFQTLDAKLNGMSDYHHSQTGMRL